MEVNLIFPYICDLYTGVLQWKVTTYTTLIIFMAPLIFLRSFLATWQDYLPIYSMFLSYAWQYVSYDAYCTVPSASASIGYT